MEKCKAGPWCMRCKNSLEIKNRELFEDYQSRLPRGVAYYTLTVIRGCFDTGYICKKAIKEICEGLEEK